MATAEHFTFLMRECGYEEPRLIGQDRYACLMPLLFTYAIITGRVGDRIGYEDRWCYQDRETAAAALESWSGKGEPSGWHRHPASGRRRRLCESGAATEWVDP